MQLFRETSCTTNSDIESSSLTFTEFLILLVRISNNVEDSLDQPANYSGNSQLRYVLTYFSVSSMRIVLDSFKDETNGMISSSSILWLLRQSGFTQLDFVSVRSLLEHLDVLWLKLSDSIVSSNQESEEKFVRPEYLPMILTYLLCKFKHLTSEISNKDDAYLSYVMYLSCHFPSCFFILNHQSILMKRLPFMYRLNFLREFKSNYSDWDNMIVSYVKYRASLIESSKEAIDENLNMGWTIESFVSYTKYSGLVPQYISEGQVRDICRFIVWPYSMSCKSLESVRIPFNDLLETLFLISQHYQTSSNEFEALASLRKVMLCLQSGIPTSNGGQNDLTLIPAPSMATETVANKENTLIILSLHDSYSVEAYCKSRIISLKKLDELKIIALLNIQSCSLFAREVVQTFTALKNQIVRVSKDQLSADDEVRSIVERALEDFCCKHHIKLETLLYQLQTHYGPYSRSSQSKEWYRLITQNDLMGDVAEAVHQTIFCFDDDVLQLLEANSSLLRFEYCRIFSHYQDDIPDIGDYVIPFPVAYQTAQNTFSDIFNSSQDDQVSAKFVLPSASLIKWAMDVAKLPMEASNNIMKSLQLITLDKSCTTFTCFICYAILCFKHKVSLKDSKDSSQSRECAQQFLKEISRHLTKLQQSLRLRLLDPMFGDISSSPQYLPPSSLLDHADTNMIVHTVAHLFRQFFDTVSTSNQVNSSQEKYLPPRPPGKLWDASRFLEFIKFCGLSSAMDASSYSRAWKAYGVYLRTLSPPAIDTWPRDVVPPLPMIFDVPALTKLLEYFANTYGDPWSIATSHGSTIGLHIILGKVILPYVCANVGKARKSFPVIDPVLNYSSIKCRLEDIFRYGGDQLIKKLENLGSWIQDSFHSFPSVSKQQPRSSHLIDMEASVSDVCDFLSCGGLLDIAIISACIPKSLHPRPRYLSQQLTLSIHEFQDMFIRCALVAWEMSGATGKSKPLSTKFTSQYRERTQSQHLPFQLPYKSVDADFLNSIQMIAELYCDYCSSADAERVSSAEVEPSTADKTTWGTDFITPYYLSLLHPSTRSYFHEPLSIHQMKTNTAPGDNLSFIANSTNMSESNNLPKQESHQDLQRQDDTVDNGGNRTYFTEEENISIQDSKIMFSSETQADDVLTTVTTALSQVSDSHISSFDDKSSHPLISSNIVEMLRESTEDSASSSLFNNYMENSKETLWSAYATYCSCGDSSEPGKLSGPNLFALLSKLGVLTNETRLSDIGILLHQITSHVNATTSANAALSTSATDSPSLTFEEFMIFLCAFSELRYSKTISAPLLGKQKQLVLQENNKSGRENLIEISKEMDAYMTLSSTFPRLMEECIQPVLLRNPFLASPEDARLRDKYSLIFSLEVLLVIEAVEKRFMSSFQYFKEEFISHSNYSPKSAALDSLDIFLYPLQQMNLVPQIMTVEKIKKFVKDLIPSTELKSFTPPQPRDYTESSIDKESQKELFNLPLWEWIIAVVAHEAVDNAVTESYLPTDPQVRFSPYF